MFVDTAPVMEKPLAQAAGLGWGAHNLLSRDLGNWFFLGAIFTTLELEPDTPEVSHCGSCTACLDICPTDAFPAPYRLDARKCISYLTIEHKGPIDPALRSKMGNRIYGCDDCLAICPWNKFAVAARDMRFDPKEAAANPPLAELATWTTQPFGPVFLDCLSSGSVVTNGEEMFSMHQQFWITFFNGRQRLVNDPDEWRMRAWAANNWGELIMWRYRSVSCQHSRASEQGAPNADFSPEFVNNPCSGTARDVHRRPRVCR